jgi:hypothetical protein
MNVDITGDEFDEAELPEADELEEDRFAFLDDRVWSEIVTRKVAPGTMKKLKFVIRLFNEWRTKRNAHEINLRVPEKDIADFSDEEYNR